MLISVDREVCQGHGQCAMVDESLFPLDPAGYSAVGDDGVAVEPGKEEDAELGVNVCPVQALRLD
ncbi:ferredoxin [Acrocarpospora catenulata]|uniref:ferredoxin n=1 Tax=Acrocarpospora catenulata TaxID=2836182 RepID=UPI001BDB3D72|nr:ferredoxin [Acrocarpospora catenulata]